MVLNSHRLVSIGGGRITFSYKDYRSGGQIKEATRTAEEFIDRFLSHVLPAGMREKRYYGLLAASRRAASLKQIREMLGVPEPAEEQPDKFLGDADAGGDEPAPGYLCPVCQKGRMLPVRELPRPTVRQIMAMPFPDEAYLKKQQKRLEGRRPRQKSPGRWLLVVPAGELRQRLLPFGFT